MKTTRIINFPTTTLFKYNFRIAFTLSVIVGITVVFVAITGIIYKDFFYPYSTLVYTFIPNDIANLVLGLPLLIVTIFVAQKGKLIGYLCWPGALFYLLYTYIPYLLSIPFNVFFLPYLLIITLSSCTLIYLIAGMNSDLIQQKLNGKVPVRLSGGVLLVLAVLIIFRQVALIVAAHIKQTPVDTQEIAIWISDLAIACPALITVGISLWRRNLLGYTTGAALLLSYGMLVLSLIIVMIFQARYTLSAVNSSDIAMLVIMAGICLWPFSLFIKAALAKSEK